MAAAGAKRTREKEEEAEQDWESEMRRVLPRGEVCCPPEQLSQEQLRAALQRRGLSAEGTRGRLVSRLYESLHMVAGPIARGGNACAVPCKKDGTPKWWARDWYEIQHGKRQRAAEAAQQAADNEERARAEAAGKRAADRAACAVRRSEWRAGRCVRALAAALDARRKGAPAVRSVLHIGCGDGAGTVAVLCRLMELCPGGGELTAIDKDPLRVAAAAARAAAAPRESWRARILEREAGGPPAPDLCRRFDCVIVSDVLQSADHDCVLGAAAGCLRDEGTLGVVAWGEGAHEQVLGAAREVLQPRGINAAMMDPIYSTLSPEAAREAVRRARLEPVSVSEDADPAELPPPAAPWLCRIARPYVGSFASDEDWMEDFALDLKAAAAARGIFRKRPAKTWSIDVRTICVGARKQQDGGGDGAAPSE
eukprot:TRINITY_DN20108_c0_g1_i1.p1 TRINITY_DN20108_c0_g1~~TRINITY_DN20108_c0_g1_i1.p1  ORF type:complete len:424 (+),score=146.06 TRINITY_DN20108_c0_g1_i1:73-1344(+)